MAAPNSFLSCHASVNQSLRAETQETSFVLEETLFRLSLTSALLSQRSGSPGLAVGLSLRVHGRGGCPSSELTGRSRIVSLSHHAPGSAGRDVLVQWLSAKIGTGKIFLE